jgi:hypothetical protein
LLPFVHVFLSVFIMLLIVIINPRRQ